MPRELIVGRGIRPSVRLLGLSFFLKAASSLYKPPNKSCPTLVKIIYKHRRLDVFKKLVSLFDKKGSIIGKMSVILKNNIFKFGMEHHWDMEIQVCSNKFPGWINGPTKEDHQRGTDISLYRDIKSLDMEVISGPVPWGDSCTGNHREDSNVFI